MQGKEGGSGRARRGKGGETTHFLFLDQITHSLYLVVIGVGARVGSAGGM